MKSLNFTNGYWSAKQMPVKTLAMILLMFSHPLCAEMAEQIPDESFLEFLGEFKNYDDDTLDIAFETPLDASEQSSATPAESTKNERGKHVYGEE